MKNILMLFFIVIVTFPVSACKTNSNSHSNTTENEEKAVVETKSLDFAECIDDEKKRC